MRLYGTLLVLSLSLTLFSSVQAVDVAYDGYIRSRMNSDYNLDLDRGRDPDMRNYVDFRFRLDPTFFITDKIRVRSSLNFFDGVFGSSQNRYGAFSNPALAYHPALNPTQDAANPIGTASNGTSSIGGVTLPDGMVTSSGLEPIQLRRAWAEVEIPFGTIKFGRMPNHFGYGIQANAGDDPNQENGMSRDRVMFDTAFGPYYFRPGFGYLIEGDLDTSSDDFMEYFAYFGRKIDDQDIGMFASFNSQNRYPTDGTKTQYWIIDFFAQNRFGPTLVGAEAAIFAGKMAGYELLAVNSVLRADTTLKPWSFRTEVGMSTGTSASQIASGDLKTVAFARDYDVSLILFEEAVPGGRSLLDTTGAAVAGASAPHSGAISNAFYARAKIGYDVVPYFQPSVNLISAFSMKNGGPAEGGRFYGFEYDLITEWPFEDYWKGELSVGHFLPGSFYDNLSRSQSALVLKVGMTAAF